MESGKAEQKGGGGQPPHRRRRAVRSLYQSYMEKKRRVRGFVVLPRWKSKERLFFYMNYVRIGLRQTLYPPP